MFKLVTNKNVSYYKSDIFPNNVNHAFTTRKGGFAPAPLDGLSTGVAQYKECLESVIKNRQLICEILEMDYDKLVMTDQEHTDNVINLDDGFELTENGFIKSTDAVITSKKFLPAMLFFADCTPVFLYDTKKQVMGLVHAGWKGTVKQITLKTAKLMVETFNSDPQNIIAAVGPNIGQCCYEVSEDVASELLQSVPKNFVSDKIVKYENGKPFVDLKLINAIQLQAYNLKQVDISDECTACNVDMFFSHRKTAGKTGRQSLVAQLT
ncbi:MAG: peptidoglycan editing factor PgeF [Vampirovibrionia bacterium]